MAQKKPEKRDEDQKTRFRRAVQEMIDAGELDPDEAEKALSHLVNQSAQDNRRE